MSRVVNIVGSGGGDLEYQTEITTSTTLTTEKGLNKVYPVNSASAVVITVPTGYVENDVINFERRGEGTVEFVPASGVRIRGVRDVENRYFINDKYSWISLINRGSDEWSIVGRLKDGYTGAVTTSSYGSLSVTETNVDITVIGRGFSDNMLVTLSANATLNSFTVISSQELTLNVDAVGGVGDTVTVTYDNGDIFVDTDAITITIQAIIPTANIVSYWKFNNNSNDSVGTNNGTDTDITYSSGFINQSATSNGGTSKIIVPDSNDLSFPSVPFSFTGWVNFTTATGNSIIFEKLQPVGALGEYLFFHDGTNLILNIYSSGGTSNYLSASTSFSPTLSQWYALGFTFDGGTNFSGIKIYIDKVSQSITNNSVGTFTGMANTTATLDLLGRDGQTGIALDGVADEFLIWDTELSQTQINAIVDEGLSGNELL